MKKGTRIIFALILLFVTVFADVRFVKAEANPKAATVYRIYANMVENEEGYYEPDFDSLEIAESNPQGKDLIAKFITDGTYVPKISIKDPTDAEVMLFLNNVTIDLRGSGEDRIKRFWDWRLAGDSSVLFDNMTVSTKNGNDVNELDVFPALSGDATIENISSVFGPYPYDLLRDENDPDKIIKFPKAPRYDISGEHMVEGEIFAGNLVIADGAVLHMKDFEAENGGTNGGIVEATVIDINGTLKMDAPSNEWAPPQIRVYADGALNLESKGSFDVAEGTELILHDNASCNDSVKSMLYKNDGSKFAWSATHGKIKFIFENGKWIYQEPAFGVDFDEWWRWDEKLDRNVPSASVSANGTDLARGEMVPFKEGEEIKFTFTMPEERSDCKPYIAIESEEYCFVNFETGEEWDQELTVSGNSFSFTPPNNDQFWVRFWWSEYDWFGPRGDDEFLVDINGDNGTVTADLSKATVIRSMNEPNDRAGKKYIISRSELNNKLNNKITFTFTPDENSRLAGADFWLDRDEKRFSLRKDDDPNRGLINEENGFTEENGVYTYIFDLSKYETSHISASAYFEDTQNLWISENEFRLRYNEFGGPEDELPGRAFVNGDYVSSCDDEDERLLYTAGEKIDFALELPFSRTGCTPIVEINTEKGEFYSSDKNAVDAKHLITLKSDNTFSFTPTDKYGFDIWINWSDFDAFWYDNNTEFLVMADHYFDGSVSITKEPKDSFVGDREDQGVKYRYDNNALEGEDIQVKLTPNEGFCVASVWLRIDKPEQEYFDAFYVAGEPGGEDRDMFEDGSGFSQEGDIVYYTIPKDAAGAFVIMSVEYREKHEDIHVDGKGRKVEYRVDKASAYTALPDDSDTIPKEAFDNADEIQIKFSNLNGDERGVRVIVNEYYQYSWLDPLEEDGTYTIRKSDIGGRWKGIEVELIDWNTPLDGQYMIQWFGPEDEMDSANGLERDKAYDIPDNGPITLKFNEPVYMVTVEPDWDERVRVDEDSNSNGRVFSYTPEDNNALTFRVYPTEEEYNYYENIYPDHEHGEFSVEYDVNIHLDENNKTVPGLGGTVTYNVETIKVGGLSETVKQHHFIRNKNKLILNGGEDGVKKITLTITPNIGCDYDFWVWDQDLTDQVKNNGNKYDWDVSEPWNIPWICVDFHQGNTPLSGTVNINGKTVYGETLTAETSGEINEEALQYQWKRGGVDITGANEATYTTVKEDVGKIITCSVSSVLQSGSLLGVTDNIIAKAEGPAAPEGLTSEAPSRAGHADGKIKGVSVLMEYATKADFSDRKECQSTEISDLKAGKYYVRIKETDVREAGEAATVTVEDGIADITGTVSISGNTKFGQTLTAKVSGSNATDFTYQWKRGDADINGATSSTYTLVKEDINQIISCVVSDKNEGTLGTISGKTSAKAENADGPAAPTGVKGTACTVKGASDGQITGAGSLMEYATKADFSDAKKCDETITGLAAGTYYVRIAETDTAKAGASAEIVIEDGPEAQKTTEELVKDFVTRFYTIILQRSQINDDEIEYYTSRLLSHELDGCTVAKGFVMSPEYTDKGEDNLTFVNKMYAAFFNREADDAAFYVNLLEAGHSREVVLAGFVNSPEFKNLCAEYGINPGELVIEPQNNNQGDNPGDNPVDNPGDNPGNNPSDDVTKLNLDSSNVDPEKLDAYVKNLYLQILGRGYDEGGLQYWKEQIMAGTTYDAATAARVGFFESPEYQGKNKNSEQFVTDCYHAFLGREPEADGLAYWTEKLDSGEYSKQKVIDLGFGHSNEFKGILTECGFRIIE